MKGLIKRVGGDLERLASEAYWTQRLDVPAYQVSDAARYARTSSQTVGNWQKGRGNKPGVVSPRDRGLGLSYLQLIEVGVVAAMRKSGLSLPKIRDARGYLAEEFGEPYPFAVYRFKTDGKSLFLDYQQILGASAQDKLLVANERGQLAWNKIIGQRLREFEYDDDIETVISWKVAGVDSPVEIDPRIAFGSPQVGGIPTWTLKDRWGAGESLRDIADDFALEPNLVLSALRFEGISYDPERPNRWPH